MNLSLKLIELLRSMFCVVSLCLGILMVNIQSFGLIDAKYMNPIAMGELQGPSYWSWWTTSVFFDSKFMAFFFSDFRCQHCFDVAE